MVGAVTPPPHTVYIGGYMRVWGRGTKAGQEQEGRDRSRRQGQEQGGRDRSRRPRSLPCMPQRPSL